MEVSVDYDKLSPMIRYTLDTAAEMAAEGLPINARSMAPRMGCSVGAAQARLRWARGSGLWAWGRYLLPVPKKVEDLGDDYTDLLKAAPGVADSLGRVSPTAVARATGYSTSQAVNRITNLRRWGLWPHEAPAPPNEPNEASAWDRAVEQIGVDWENRRRMGDGRAEVDDPAEHGSTPPRSGKDHAPPTLAFVTRSYVREWKIRTGRLVPKAPPASKRTRTSERAKPYDLPMLKTRPAWVNFRKHGRAS